jgi:hypothetical protein
MIAIHKQDVSASTWHSEFLNLLPELESRLKTAFRRLDPDAREEAVQEATVLSLFSYSRLAAQERANAVSASNLAWYSALQVKRGRSAGTRMNGREVLSRYAQIGKGFRVERLDALDTADATWIQALIDQKGWPILDQVAAKLDVCAWFASLSRRMKQIATDLASGFTTAEAAQKYGLTRGRISQMRRSLETSWHMYQHESSDSIVR